jgi:hypothetical protein
VVFAPAPLSRLCDYTSVGTWTLPRIVGSAKAREMYLLNRKVDAAEALRIGLCSGVYESAEALMEGVYELAEELASAPPLALRRIKQNLNAADELSFVEGLDQVRTLVLLPPSQQRKPLAGFDPCALSTSQQGSWVWLVHRPSLIAHRSSRACVRACARGAGGGEPCPRCVPPRREGGGRCLHAEEEGQLQRRGGAAALVQEPAVKRRGGVRVGRVLGRPSGARDSPGGAQPPPLAATAGPTEHGAGTHGVAGGWRLGTAGCGETGGRAAGVSGGTQRPHRPAGCQ